MLLALVERPYFCRAGTGRGDAAAGTRIVRGDDVAAAATCIFSGGESRPATGPRPDDGAAARRRSRGVSVDPPSEYPRDTPRRGRDPPSTTRAKSRSKATARVHHGSRSERVVERASLLGGFPVTVLLPSTPIRLLKQEMAGRSFNDLGMWPAPLGPESVSFLCGGEPLDEEVGLGRLARWARTSGGGARARGKRARSAGVGSGG